jgi:hypothetical protein
MKINKFKIDNKEIEVIDSFYSSKADKEVLYLSACNANYNIKGKPSEDIQNRNNLRLESELNLDLLNRMHLFEGERKEFFDTYLNSADYEIYRAYINLGLISDYQDIHVDHYEEGIGKTLLVYCNRVWDDNWGGETYFYSKDAKQVEYVSKLEPGKAILFDGTIPHMAKVQHTFCDNYRFTLAIKFVKRNK